MFGWFKKKSEIEEVKQETLRSFDAVKEDFRKVGSWIEVFDDKANSQKKELDEVKKQVFNMQNQIEELKDFISVFGNKMSKQPQTSGVKQPVVDDVQTVVQTAVQTGFLTNLTVMERAIVWALANSEMKLSYEDLAAMLGKDKSTIRGQINTIKQKSEGLIEEYRELTGKKRLFIPAEIRQKLVKTAKVRVRNDKKEEKSS